MYVIKLPTSNRQTLAVCCARFSLPAFVEGGIPPTENKYGFLISTPSRRDVSAGVGSKLLRVLKRARYHLDCSAHDVETA